MNETEQHTSEQTAQCCVCCWTALSEVIAYRSFRRVTSDCRPWPAGGRLAVCARCGCVQGIPDETFVREINAIYTSYAIYHQSQGEEQTAFDTCTGAAAPRSRRLLSRFLERVKLPMTGRMLDVGCGNGATLKAFSHIRPAWSLVGTELNEKYRSDVEAIAGQDGFYTSALEAVPGDFDLISMIHVIEHVVNPLELLKGLRSKLRPGARLLVEVPSYRQNPFELLIADHRTHFDAPSLSLLLERAGYAVEVVAEDWVAKELSVVGRVNGGGTTSSARSTSASVDCGSLEPKLLWLASVVAAWRSLAASRPIGIFGTSIAATWLASELEGAAAFFVDEDEARIGKQFMRRPILHPRQLIEGSEVFLALPTNLAESVAHRLQRAGVRYHIPPHA